MELQVSLPNKEIVKTVSWGLLNSMATWLIIGGKIIFLNEVNRSREIYSISQLSHLLPPGQVWKGQFFGVLKPGSEKVVHKRCDANLRSKHLLVSEENYPFTLIDPNVPADSAPMEVTLDPTGAIMRVYHSAHYHGGVSRIRVKTTSSVIAANEFVYVVGEARNLGTGEITVSGGDKRLLISQGIPISNDTHTGPLTCYIAATVLWLISITLKPASKTQVTISKGNYKFIIEKECIDGEIDRIIVVVHTHGIEQNQVAPTIQFVKENINISVNPSEILINDGVFTLVYLIPRKSKQKRFKIINIAHGAVLCALAFAWVDLFLSISYSGFKSEVI